MHLIPSRSLALALAVAAVGSAAQAAERPTYGPQMEGFEQPHEIHRHALDTQGQKLEMGYMDIAPMGEANGQTAVLLHGKNFCAATWEGTIAELTKAGYRVVAPDQVGFCTASKPEGYQFSFAQLAHNTRDLLESLDVKEAVLVGHSMGGMLATRFALSYPDQVSRLVLVNPIGLEDWQAEGVPYASVDEAFETERKTNFDSIKKYQQDIYYNGDWKPAYDRWVQMQAGMYAGPGGEIVAMNQAQTSDMVFTQPVVHEFGRLQVPTVLMIGMLDRTAPGANRAPDEVAQRLGNYPELTARAEQAIPGATVVTFDTLGHSPQIEAPEIFHKALLETLAAEPTPKPE